jgi:hypothetical protein
MRVEMAFSGRGGVAQVWTVEFDEWDKELLGALERARGDVPLLEFVRGFLVAAAGGSDNLPA